MCGARNPFEQFPAFALGSGSVMARWPRLTWCTVGWLIRLRSCLCSKRGPIERFLVRNEGDSMLLCGMLTHVSRVDATAVAVRGFCRAGRYVRDGRSIIMGWLGARPGLR